MAKCRMRNDAQLGHVESLFPHVKGDWWKDAFNEMYLRTDGDVVEDPAITEAECNEMLSIEAVSQLFNTGTAGGRSLRVLDLCCGQGRHSVYFAEKYPNIEFHGLDSSAYLIEIARLRAKEAQCKNVSFDVGDARHIPSEDDTFDLIIMMGNSFGVYSDEDDNAALLEEVGRTLKSGGTFLADMVSAEYTKSNFQDGGWEFINGGKFPIPNSTMTADDKSSETMIACRERELSTDGKWLASREMVIGMSRGILQDLFYKFRLYEVEEMERLLHKSRMVLDRGACQELFGPAGEGTRNGDLGMMASRHLIVGMSSKGSDHTNGSSITPNASEESLPNVFVHPCLVINTDPVKGRVVRVTTDVEAGTLLMVDDPYALVPDITPESGDFLPCSRLECSKRVTDPIASVTCPQECNSDVIWCNASCQSLGKARHDLECTWLKRNATRIVQNHGQYDMTMLWIIVRTLVSRSLEKQLETDKQVSQPTFIGDLNSLDFKFAHNYIEIQKLRNNYEAIVSSKIEHYHALVNDFLGPNSGFQSEVEMQEIVDLICKEEMNAFCLYPKGTSAPGVTKGRGRAYALGLYTRATWMNHDCEPNMTHKPNRNSQYTFRTTRDLAAGEECTIAYTDLMEPQYADVKSRRAFMKEWFTFDCTCRRCEREMAAST
ncbi:uncharacterized protein RSE6_09069 [Rhynchosporium secalis]|uniref:SET domain-containing protein n=1 Tax=Rhynchosporium secalis TaxID=38038 RepID=A0A1E1MH37_RHYSE|nr:uncharacterized protein RSE6_09069 [Rhynchosporium secalis]